MSAPALRTRPSAPPAETVDSLQSPTPPSWRRRLLPVLNRHRRLLIGTAVLAAVYAALGSTLPLIQQIVLDDAIIAKNRPLLPWLGLLAVFGLIIGVLSMLWRYRSGKAALAIQHDIRNDIYDTLQRLDFSGHSQLQSGQLVSRASTDLRWVQMLIGFIAEVAATTVGITVSLVVMFRLSPLLAVVVMIIIGTVFVITHRMRTQVHASGWDSQQKEAELMTEIEEAVLGVRVVRAFGQEAAQTTRLHHALLNMFRARVRAVRLRAPFFASLMAGPQLGQVIIIALGGLLVINGYLTVGVFLAFSSYLTGLAGKARVIGMILSNLPQCQAAVERIGDILDLRPDLTEPAEPVTPTDQAGTIDFRDVSFAYVDGDGHQVLRHLDLSIAAGESIALVGPSGCGKSTAMQLIGRFFDPTDGSVLVDGVDVRAQSLSQLRGRVGMVFENSFLFSDTIANNISYGRPDATDDEIRAAARAAMADDFITRLDDGYDTLIGEQGMTLSGGQRQRVALARALLVDPDILLLDDATSSVDTKVEHEIHANLGPFLASRTAVMVAYRESTVRMADRVVLLDDGHVVDHGTHEELFDRSALYRDLFGEMAGGDDDAAGLLPAARRGDFAPTASAWESRQDASGRPPAELETPPDVAAKIAALPTFDDHPGVDLDGEGRRSEPFKLVKFLSPYRYGLLAGLLLVALETVLALVNPLLIREGVNGGMLDGSLPVLGMVCVGAALLAGGLFFVQRGSQLTTQRTTERLLVALRSRVYGQLQRLGIDFYDRTQAGRIMTRMTSDIDAIAELLQVGLINLLMAILTFSGMSIVVLALDPRLALTVLCVVPPAAVATWWYRRRASVAYDEARERTSILNSNLQESLAGIRVTHAYRREATNLDRFAALGRDFMFWSKRSSFATAVYVGVIEILSTSATVAVLGLGARFVDAGTLAVGTLLAFMLYLAQVFAPIQQLATVFDVYQRARAGLVRISELLGLKTSTPVADAPVRPDVINGDIKLEGVRLRYAGTTSDALKRVDLHIPAGQRVAFVGRTGAGKSTTVKLVSRFYDPTEGRILVDDIDLDQFDLADYRNRMGYVPQEPHLFTRSVRDNIAYGRPDASDAEVEAAARAVGAHEFISRMPGGYRQLITERGRSLSAGQRQLLCLARALIVDPSILILDEATSNLDLASERKVNQAMRVAAQGRTTLVVTHRPQSLHWVERVLVVSDGAIVGDQQPADYLATM
ncbi:ABC transporter ATP-binding protein [Microlunatus soli]|uniref:ATP-binding cassette, subfamily B n=1 Tax=Microlunatus soli TaxID=630515 RepID=A0A1H1SZP1_9ACTN|nr:ABC transporter ATP-binding protein [Microlunatus soli]SDS53462.1 ATP-binding cassette, subfamily B [Microlunatus soli]